MRIKSILAVGCLLVSVGYLGGCSSGNSSDGVKAEDKAHLMDANALAKKVDGDYDKLSPSEKEVVLKTANGNEASARSLFKMMAHPPNEANIGRVGGSPPTGK